MYRSRANTIISWKGLSTYKLGSTREITEPGHCRCAFICFPGLLSSLTFRMCHYSIFVQNQICRALACSPSETPSSKPFPPTTLSPLLNSLPAPCSLPTPTTNISTREFHSLFNSPIKANSACHRTDHPPLAFLMYLPGSLTQHGRLLFPASFWSQQQ